jgi:hypothetical protein
VGERTNFGFRQSNDSIVFLYSHWGGEHGLESLAIALAASRTRWEDESYATRIAISNIIGNEWGSETGYGIYVNTIGDNEYDIPIADFSTEAVSVYGASWDKEPDFNSTPKFVMGFEAFITKYSMYLTTV